MIPLRPVCHPFWLIAEVPVTSNDRPFYRIGDHLDSLAQKTDSVGNLLGTNDVSPWGELISSSATDRLLFTDHERDTENGSDSALFRQYTSAQGRWLAPDPYNGSYNLTDPQSLNRYAYLADRPLSSSDSSGLLADGLYGPDGGGGELGGLLGVLFGSLFGGLFNFFDGGASRQGPDIYSQGGYGNPYDTNGAAALPEYVTPRSSDPGSLGESLGIPTSIPHGVWGIGPALGLPSTSCDFGPCGGGPLGLGNGTVAAAKQQASSAFNFIAFLRALQEIYDTYNAMKAANTIGADKYFHCTAMYGATAMGPGGAAAAGSASVGREIGDTVKYQVRSGKGHLPLGASLRDSKEDLQADFTGIDGAIGAQASACSVYKVRGLP